MQIPLKLVSIQRSAQKLQITCSFAQTISADRELLILNMSQTERERERNKEQNAIALIKLFSKN